MGGNVGLDALEDYLLLLLLFFGVSFGALAVWNGKAQRFLLHQKFIYVTTCGWSLGRTIGRFGCEHSYVYCRYVFIRLQLEIQSCKK